MSVPALIRALEAKTGCAFVIRSGQLLEITDIEGRQVADVTFFSLDDPRERFSAGRTLDYNGRIRLTTGSRLFSNRSNPMAAIERDSVGVHDYLLAPCSQRMFELLHGSPDHASCHENLSTALAPFGVSPDEIEATFNAFMNVNVEADGHITIGPPPSAKGDSVSLRALSDLIVGITACSSEWTNAGRCKPIGYRLL